MKKTNSESAQKQIKNKQLTSNDHMSCLFFFGGGGGGGVGRIGNANDRTQKPWTLGASFRIWLSSSSSFLITIKQCKDKTQGRLERPAAVDLGIANQPTLCPPRLWSW